MTVELPEDQAAAPDDDLRRIRVWVGRFAITDVIAHQAWADRYAAMMARRFPSLTVTNHPVHLAEEEEQHG